MEFNGYHVDAGRVWPGYASPAKGPHVGKVAMWDDLGQAHEASFSGEVMNGLERNGMWVWCEGDGRFWYVPQAQIVPARAIQVLNQLVLDVDAGSVHVDDGVELIVDTSGAEMCGVASVHGVESVWINEAPNLGQLIHQLLVEVWRKTPASTGRRPLSTTA